MANPLVIPLYSIQDARVFKRYMVQTIRTAKANNEGNVILEMPRAIASDLRAVIGPMPFKDTSIKERLRDFDKAEDVYFMPDISPEMPTPIQQPKKAAKKKAAKPAPSPADVAEAARAAARAGLAAEQPAPEPGFGLNDGGERRIINA